MSPGLGFIENVFELGKFFRIVLKTYLEKFLQLQPDLFIKSRGHFITNNLRR
jgi:hypothetical protein